MKTNFNSEMVTVPLSDLAPGREGVIERVDGLDPIGGRLQDLGFLPDTHVRVLRRAPLGDPVIYELRGTRLCLRRRESQRIRVRVRDSALDSVLNRSEKP